MRMIFASTHYPPWTPGGSAESVRLQAEALVRAGHEVVVVTPRWGRVAAKREQTNGVLVSRFSVNAELPAGQVLAAERVVLGRDFQATAEGYIKGFVDELGADLVHVQDRRLIGPAYTAARAAGVPSMVTLRDTGLLCPIATCLLHQPSVPKDCGQVKLWRECGPWYRDHYSVAGGVVHSAKLALRYRDLDHVRGTAERMDCVAFVSAGLREVYASVGFPLAGVRTAVLPSPVDPAPPVADEVAAQLRRSHRLEDKPIVLFVGKPSLGKGWPIFTACAETRRDLAHFVHVGPGNVSHPGLRDNVGILSIGPVSHDAALAWMRAADIVMVPSLQADALPRVALEAQAQGTPVVGTRRGGIPEAVQVGEVAEPEEIPAALFRVLSHDRMPTTARLAVLKEFGPEATTARLIECYEEVLG